MQERSSNVRTLKYMKGQRIVQLRGYSSQLLFPCRLTSGKSAGQVFRKSRTREETLTSEWSPRSTLLGRHISGFFRATTHRCTKTKSRSFCVRCKKTEGIVSNCAEEKWRGENFVRLHSYCLFRPPNGNNVENYLFIPLFAFNMAAALVIRKDALHHHRKFTVRFVNFPIWSGVIYLEQLKK